MSDKTGIEWTRGDDGTPGATWNPVTGCTKVSAGCDHCYAETFAERWRGIPGHYFENGFDVTLRPGLLDKPLRWTRPRRVFVNSMSDLFHDQVPDEFIGRVFAVMALARQHTFQVLTKRHGRMRSLLGNHAFWTRVAVECLELQERWPVPGVQFDAHCLPNVWLGVSAEDQQWADIRAPALLDTPAAVRFVSAEPLLGPVSLHPYWTHGKPVWGEPETARTGLQLQALEIRPGINWLICGGESGAGARPMHPDWARSLRDQCAEADVSFFFKQWGEWGPAPWRVDREPGESAETYKARAEAVCATHAYPVWAARYGHEPHRASHKPWSLERTSLPPEQAPIRRWGKHAAGRELDGRTWDEFPRTTEAVTL